MAKYKKEDIRPWTWGDFTGAIGQGYEWMKTHTLTGKPRPLDVNLPPDKPATTNPPVKKRAPAPVTRAVKATKTVFPPRPETPAAAPNYGVPESNRGGQYTTSRSYGGAVGGRSGSSALPGKTTRGGGGGYKPNPIAHGASHDTSGLKFFK